MLRVQETGDEVNGPPPQLIHGNIMHGKQYLRADLKREADELLHAQLRHRPRASRRCIRAWTRSRSASSASAPGTIAAYGSKGDVYRFYDINPGVDRHRAARLHATSSDSDATIELPLGDARLTLEREPPQDFDVLAIDAFSSDAIPVHLITTEAVEVYLRHMKPDGVIAFHVTNRYLDLVPVVEGIAHELGLHALWIDDDGDDAARQLVELGAAGQGPGAARRSRARRRRPRNDRARAATGACGPTTSTTWCRC